MTKDEIEDLIKIATPDEQIRIKVLYNASIQGIQEYNETKSAAKLKDWKAAEEELNKFAVSIRARNRDPETKEFFQDLGEVLEYLEASVYEVKKSTLYRHANREGKLQRETDGTYSLKMIEKYAKTWLRLKSTGKKEQARIDAAQARKLDLELEVLEIEKKKKQFELDKVLGKYMPTDDVAIELASRAGILDAGLKHWIQSHAAGYIKLVDGDSKKVGELINQMTRDIDEHINNYAASREYEVVFEAEEKEDGDGDNA